MQDQSNANRTWQIMKEIPGTKKFELDSLPERPKFKNREITKPYEVSNQINKFFARIGPNSASSITNTTESFKRLLNTV